MDHLQGHGGESRRRSKLPKFLALTVLRNTRTAYPGWPLGDIWLADGQGGDADQVQGRLLLRDEVLQHREGEESLGLRAARGHGRGHQEERTVVALDSRWRGLCCSGGWQEGGQGAVGRQGRTRTSMYIAQQRAVPLTAPIYRSATCPLRATWSMMLSECTCGRAKGGGRRRQHE